MIRRPRERVDSESVTPLPYKRTLFGLETPCSSLCTNRDGTRLAIVGRKLFKILKLSPDQFEVVTNLRDLPHKQLNLNFSSNDVQWNPKDETQLATAPTNGSVILWDISKQTKSKLAHAFEGSHQRAVNKLSFHPREPNCLLSGSQDNTMAMFDTRQKTEVTVYRGPDSVRDVKFPTLPSGDYFAACFDNGMLQIWDRRRGDNPVKQLSVHNGPAYCCTWHPEQENYIMSAGRDKMIKVFDIQQARAKEVATVHALFSVARVRWRPGQRFQITSCSHFLDNMVAIWDFRRPYIPFASFTEHTDDVLLTCSKDGKLIQQLFSEAERPAERATPVGLSFRPDGCLAQACSDSLAYKNKTTHPSSQSSRHPMVFRKVEADSYQQAFLLHTSTLREHTKMEAINDKEHLKMSHFINCAKLYKLHGLPVHELCDHNYKVADHLGKQDVSQTWLILKLLYCGGNSDCSRLGLIQTNIPPRHSAGSRLSTTQPPSIHLEGASESPSIAGRESTLADCKGVVAKEYSASADSIQDDNEEETEENNAGDVSADIDFFEDDEKDSDVGPSQNLVQQPQQSWGELPAEPFQLRHDIVQRELAKVFLRKSKFCALSLDMSVPCVEVLERMTAPSPDHEASSAVSTSHSAVESSSSIKPHLLEGLTYSKQNSVVKPPWNFSPAIGKMLKFYAEQGDVQTTVSVLLVLTACGRDLVDDRTMEQWFSSYIDLLMRHQLWCVAALVIKLCPLSVINEMSQQSTAYHTGCGNCNKLMEKHGWQCRRCDKVASLCSVCHETVRGLFVWCQECGHGGHLQHIQEWHRYHVQCPAGCGHDCIRRRMNN